MQVLGFTKIGLELINFTFTCHFGVYLEKLLYLTMKF